MKGKTKSKPHRPSGYVAKARSKTPSARQARRGGIR